MDKKPFIERLKKEVQELKKAGWSINDISLVESNEAFAAQAIAVNKELGLDEKIVNVNVFTSRILLASDLNSKIPVIIEPSGINAILSGKGNNNFAELEYLPKNNNLKNGDVVYTSGVDGIIASAIPIGKVFINEENKYVEFFVDLNQLQFVKINY